MAILRRSDQKRTSNRPGASSYRLAGPETGSQMLTISDITLEPGAEIAYHSHPNSEASHYVVDGTLECLLDGKRMTTSEGDLALAPTGVGHGFANRSDRPARFIAMMPSTEPGREQEDDSHVRDVAGPDDLPAGAALRSRVQAWTPWEGCLRYDMATADFGSTSTAFSELIFNPGAVAPPHY
ncbi:MAG: cupin domain-containing protein, partial [Chloroflexota bacterium]